MIKQDNNLIEYYLRMFVQIIHNNYYNHCDFSSIVKKNERLFKKKMGRKLNMIESEMYSDKLQYLKLYDKDYKKTICTDKFLVREWVSKKIGDDYLIPLLGVWDRVEDVDFASLPEQFVLKTNCSSGDAIIVKNKSMLTKRTIRSYKRCLNFHLHERFGYKLFELHYNSISPKIVAETYLESNGNLLDYKIHCFNGKPKIIQIIGDRDIKKHQAKEAIYDISWRRNSNMYSSYVQYEGDIPKPNNLETMLELAHELSKGFIYVRVDLYNINGVIKFGEMTFTPMAGFGRWNSKEQEEEVGRWIDLSMLKTER